MINLEYYFPFKDFFTKKVFYPDLLDKLLISTHPYSLYTVKSEVGRLPKSPLRRGLIASRESLCHPGQNLYRLVTDNPAREDECRLRGSQR